MKHLFLIMLCCIAMMAGAQTQISPPFTFVLPQAGKEITILKSQSNYNTLYYNTATYNDIFNLSVGSDEFILPSQNYYKEKKVAKVSIFETGATPQFTLELNSSGQAIKTTRVTDLLREEQFFYDEKGRNNMVIKSYSRNDMVLRLDTIRYILQRKVIHDTVYEYTTVYNTIYKSGAFLNEQNKWYNKTYFLTEMEPLGPGWVYTIAKKGTAKGTNIYQYKKFACNYKPDQFYFSCQYVDVSDHKFSFHDTLFNPGEKALEKYVPEFKLQETPQYSNLPCEQFQEPSFMRTRFFCGSSRQSTSEFIQMQMNTQYISTQNSNQLQDTCYSTYGSSKNPRYYFTYTFFD